MKKVFLHTCCAPCFLKCQESLEAEGITPVLFWYNPNIHPWTEYNSRKECLINYAKEKSLEIKVRDSYGLRSFISDIYPEFKKGRCEYCYNVRLEETAKSAVEEGYNYFSTTLLISPYQNHELIKSIGEEIAKKYDIEFFYRDFRPHFREGQRLARLRGFYMQKYCGCIFSEEERYLKA